VGDLGDDAGAMQRREGLDLEDDLVVALVEEEIDAGDTPREAEGGGGVGGEVVDAVTPTPGQARGADHGADLPGGGGVALDLHGTQDLAVEEDDLDLAPVDGSLEQPGGGVVLGGGRGDGVGVGEVAHAVAMAAAAGLEDTGPAEQSEGLAAQRVGAPERQGGRDREAVEAEDLASPQLVVGEGDGRRGGAGEGDLAQGKEALELAAGACGPVGGDQAGADVGGPELEVEVVVGRENGCGVAEALQGDVQILATLGVDLAIIPGGGARAACGRVVIKGRGLDENAKVVRAHDFKAASRPDPCAANFRSFPQPLGDSPLPELPTSLPLTRAGRGACTGNCFLMTFLEAAIEVLRHEPEPLHFAEIAKRAVQRNLLSHVGRDPEAAMRTCLNSAVRGDQAILTRNKPGYYAISEGVSLPPPATVPAPVPAPVVVAPVAVPVAPVAVPVAAVTSDAVKITNNIEVMVERRETIASPVAAGPGPGNLDDAEAEGDEDGRGGDGGRRKRRRNRFGVRGEAPPPQLVAVKPSRRGADTSRRSEVLEKVQQLEFEAPRGAGLDGVTDVALVMANAMSRLAEERPELRSEFESMQRGPSTASAPTPEVRNLPRRLPPRPGTQGNQFNGNQNNGNQFNGNQNNGNQFNGNQSNGGNAGLDEDERGGRRRRRRRKRGRRVEWSGEGGDSRAGGEQQAQGLLGQVAAVLADAGARSLHIRQIAEQLAGQNVLGGEISEIERAVTAGVLLDIRKLGRASRFVARGDARYQLQTSRLPGPAASAEQSLRVAADLLDTETTNQLVQWLLSLGPRSLEALARIYLEREGFGLVTTLPPVRGVGKLVVQDPEVEDEDGRLLVIVLPRKAGLDPSSWAGDAERNNCGGHLVFAMGDAPDLNEQRTVGPHEFARWLRTQGIGVTTLAIEVIVLDPTVIESIGGLDT
jgi:hypothetical protein